MFNFFKNFGKTNRSKIDNIKIGSYYKLSPNKNNPFETEMPPVLVKDIKNGYVLYAINPGALVFQNENMKLDTFSEIYEFVAETNIFKSKEQIFIEKLCKEFNISEEELKNLDFPFGEVLKAFNEGIRNGRTL